MGKLTDLPHANLSLLAAILRLLAVAFIVLLLQQFPV